MTGQPVSTPSLVASVVLPEPGGPITIIRAVTGISVPQQGPEGFHVASKLYQLASLPVADTYVRSENRDTLVLFVNSSVDSVLTREVCEVFQFSLRLHDKMYCNREAKLLRLDSARVRACVVLLA